jgi:hypothetical protein
LLAAQRLWKKLTKHVKDAYKEAMER